MPTGHASLVRIGTVIDSLGPVAAEGNMSYDLVIKNGTVIDGSGAPRYRADVAIAGRHALRRSAASTARRSRRSTPKDTS